MSIVYKRPEVFTNEYMKYCGGCGHGIINRLIGEIIEEQNWKEKTVIVITHKKEILSKVDQIVVLKEGVVDDIGTYDELVGKNDELNIMMEKAD